MQPAADKPAIRKNCLELRKPVIELGDVGAVTSGEAEQLTSGKAALAIALRASLGPEVDLSPAKTRDPANWVVALKQKAAGAQNANRLMSTGNSGAPGRI